MMSYLQQLTECFETIEARDQRDKELCPEIAVFRIVALVAAAAKRGNKVMVIGNGGSAAIG